jgi:hypothetical protein
LAAAVALVVWGAAGLRRDSGLPLDQLAQLDGPFHGGRTHLSLLLDAGTRAGAQPVVKVSYDFNGDGNWDHTQSSQPLALDAREGWERVEVDLAQADLRDFSGGRVQVELLNAEGVKLDGPSSRITLPYRLRA